MEKQNMTKEELLLELEKANEKIEDLKTSLNTVRQEKDVLSKYLYSVTDACKTYFTSKTISKEQFYILYKRSSRGNIASRQ